MKTVTYIQADVLLVWACVILLIFKMNLGSYFHMRKEPPSNTLGNIFSLYSYKGMAIN